jgi:hypothetical protein
MFEKVNMDEPEVIAEMSEISETRRPIALSPSAADLALLSQSSTPPTSMSPRSSPTSFASGIHRPIQRILISHCSFFLPTFTLLQRVTTAPTFVQLNRFYFN